LVVEPRRLVIGEPGGQDLGLPSAGRGLEALELPDHDLDGVRTFHTRVGQNALPAEQETQEITRRDGLDLGAQSTHGVSVYAREQAALAPLLRCCARGKASAREALGPSDASAAAMFCGSNPSGAASAATVVGPRPESGVEDSGASSGGQ
jgi:hypothetical protein